MTGREGGWQGSGAAGGGCLYLVATPIGNLGDVTFRAVEVLRSVPLAAAEDTRITRRLFVRYEIVTPLVSYHAQSGPVRERELLAHLREGRDLAVVTDAGTPAVSDPGGELASAWAAEGGRVVAIPGASAVLAALVAAALPAPRWCFEGFLPRSGAERRTRLARIAADDRATVLFEAAPRVRGTLGDLARACGERRAAVCRELTKIHEEVVRGTLTELAAAAREGSLTLRGEFAIVVSAAVGSAGADRGADHRAERADVLEAARAEVAELVASGARPADAAREVAARRGVRRRDVYTASRPGAR